MINREKINAGALNKAKCTIRTVSLVLILTILTTLFASCHGSVELEEFTVPTEFDMTKQYEITFWAKNETNDYQKSVYQNAIDSFETLYPNISVKIRHFTKYPDIYNEVINNIPTKTTPNVCITYPDHIATYLQGKNTVICLDELLDDPKYGLGGSQVLFDSPSSDEIIPEFLEECYIGDKCYALPFMRSTEACYINKTYVEALGYTVPDVLTWDFIWEVSEAALAKGSDGNYIVNGQDKLIPFIYKSTDNMMIQMLRQLDASYSTENGNILIFNEDTKEVLRTIAEHVGTGAFSTFGISSYPGNWLNQGRCIFAIDSTAGATWMGLDAPNSDVKASDDLNFETVVRAVPQYDTDNPKMISQGPSVCIFNKDDPGEVLASWLFLQYLLSDSVQIAYAQTEGYVPVTSTAQSSPDYLEYLSRAGETNADGKMDPLYHDVKIAASKLLIENMENTFTTEVFNGSASLREASGQMIENVARSVRRGETINDKYIQDLYKDIASLYRLDSIAINGKTELGSLPSEAMWMIVMLVVAWLGIIAYAAVSKMNERRKRRKYNKD
jgi:multiple sugar transport system substrate-binding protein